MATRDRPESTRARVERKIPLAVYLSGRHSTEFQPETLRTVVGVGVLDQVFFTADRAIAKQAPPNIFFATACPAVEQFINVLGELGRHHLVLHGAPRYHARVEI
jgi:hypothetical protein